MCSVQAGVGGVVEEKSFSQRRPSELEVLFSTYAVPKALFLWAQSLGHNEEIICILLSNAVESSFIQIRYQATYQVS